ncbi:TPA: hypothetical protein ACXJGC_003684 [Burkholderia cenocepacia]|uniref:hypothetical protein n=1 Tax=Burkholderia cenocepacia TaxID=95486 RepID=UPI000F5AA7C1|nr:hypothetical protein [Burkholderia cenocepacia]
MTLSAPPSGWPPVSSSGRITYRPATPEDAAALAPKLRQSDIAEMALTWAGSPEARLAESVRVSAEAWALLIDGEIEALFGLVRYPLANVPWMRCSAAIAGHTRELLTHARAWLGSVRAADVPLANTVASNNAEAMAMLEHLGFIIGDVVPDQGPPGSFRFFYEVPRRV